MRSPATGAASSSIIVIGNPPYLSQMAANTSRGGSSRHGGGPYADAAFEFLALAVRLANPDRGRVATGAPPVDPRRPRRRTDPAIGRRAGRPLLVVVGAATAALRRQRQRVRARACGVRRPASRHRPAWTRVVTDRLGVPALDPRAWQPHGTLGDRAELNANFRDEYYALVPAVGDDATGPPLVTSGLIDPGRCLWGQRPVRFAKRVVRAPPRRSLEARPDDFPLGRPANWCPRCSSPIRHESSRRLPTLPELGCRACR